MEEDLLQALSSLLDDPKAGPVINHFERWLGIDVDRGEFFGALRDLLDGITSRHPSSGAVIRGGVARVLNAWGDYHLGLLENESAEDYRSRILDEAARRGLTVEEVRREHDRGVIDGLTRFFARVPVPRDGGVVLVDLAAQFRHLAMLGYNSDRQWRSVYHWLFALHRQGEWQAVARVAGEFLAAHWWPFWVALQDRNAGAVVAFLVGMTAADREQVTYTLANWLRATALDPTDAPLEDTGPQLVPAVAATALMVWEEHRDGVAAVMAADDGQFWGGWEWALEALVARLRYVREEGDDPALARLLADHSERFATRMALVHVPDVGPPVVSLECGPDNPAVLDPGPESPAGRADRSPFPEPRVPGGGQPIPRPFDRAGRQSVPRCDPALYRSLTGGLGIGQEGTALPIGTAYLALADLPISHTPVGLLMLRGPNGSVQFEVAVGPGRPNDGRRSRDPEIALRAFDPAFAADWERYRTDESANAARRLGEQLDLRSRQRAETLNRLYGPVVDDLFRRMAARGLPQEWFQKADLLVAARGLAQFAPTELLGTAYRVADWSASVTHVPSLSVFAHLRGCTAAGDITGPVRLAVAGWEPVRLDSGGVNLHSGHGSGVRGLMDEVVRQFGRRTDYHLQMAAEDPVASLGRVVRLLEGADIGVLFGHGRTAPCGLRLADGLFPDDLPEPAARGPAMLLLACCYAGRIGQMEGRADGFSPIVDEVVMRLMLSEGVFTARRPNLVGAFVEAVPTVTGASLVCDLLRERARGVDASGGFGLARAFRRVLERYQAAGQGPDGLGLLRVFTARSWRLFGVEPPAAWPVV